MTTTTTTTTAGGSTTTRTTTVTTTALGLPPQGAAPKPLVTTAPKFPNSLDELTVEWLSELLGSTVLSFTSKTIESGAMSDASLIFPTYAPGCSGKSSVFLKYQKGAEQARSMAMGANMYEKELLFFKELATGSLRDVLSNTSCTMLPECMGTWQDPAKPKESFCLALENLSEGYDVLEGHIGITYEDAETMIVPIARMHAHFWNDQELAKTDWLLPEGGGKFKPWFDSWVMFFMMDKVCPLPISSTVAVALAPLINLTCFSLASPPPSVCLSARLSRSLPPLPNAPNPSFLFHSPSCVA